MGIPTVKLNFKPYAEGGTNKVAFEVPWKNIGNVNRAIEKKTKRNKGEQVTPLEAKSYVVGEYSEER